jgi:hypothetical protein
MIANKNENGQICNKTWLRLKDVSQKVSSDVLTFFVRLKPKSFYHIYAS